MKHSLSFGPDFASLNRREFETGERAVTRAMNRAAREIKEDWRGQVTGAGLGRKLGNTVRSASYPKGDVSMNAAALVWTKAPKIVAAHNEGALIQSREGFWLAIPLPAAGRARGGRKTTPLDFERRTGLRLRFVYRPGGTGLLVADDARTTKKAGLARRNGGKRRKKDGILTGAQTVPVFVLVPQARLKKKLDLQAGANRIAAQVPGWIVAGMGSR